MSAKDVVTNLGQPIGRYSADEYGRSLACPNVDSIFTYSPPYSFVTFWVEFNHDDGNYPPLHTGQLVNLSFEIGAQVLKRMWWRGSTMLHHLGDARYRFVADVIAVYRGKRSESLAVFDADGFRFYIQSDRATRWKPGTRVAGEGMLMVDHYSWVMRRSFSSIFVMTRRVG